MKIYWTLPLLATVLVAQMAPTLTIEPLTTINVVAGSPATITLKASLPGGYHANSNKPTYSYLIPLTVKWTGGPLQIESIEYPAGITERYGFQLPTDKPLSVVTGQFSIVTKFKVPVAAVSGPAAETGTLRYQACDNKACYPPKNVPINVTVVVENKVEVDKAKADAIKAKADAEKAAAIRAQFRADCQALYKRTSDKRVSDLTVKETQQVRTCEASDFYPPR